MRSLETRIERLEEKMPPENEDYPITVVEFTPWCSVGAHALPYGYLKAYKTGPGGRVERLQGETEEDLYARALEVAKEHRGPGCGIGLNEDREKVPCTECSGAATRPARRSR